MPAVARRHAGEKHSENFAHFSLLTPLLRELAGVCGRDCDERPGKYHPGGFSAI